MRIKTRAGLLLAFVTTVLLSEPFNSWEPSYNSKSLTAWLKDLNSIEPEIWHRAESAVRAIGASALPVLAERLRARDSSSRLKLIEFFDRYPVIDLESAADYHDAALEACRILGATAAPLVPDIVPFLDGNYRTHAVKVLAAVGDSDQAETVLAELSCLTNDPVFSVREQARVAVSRIRQASALAFDPGNRK